MAKKLSERMAEKKKAKHLRLVSSNDHPQDVYDPEVEHKILDYLRRYWYQTQAPADLQDLASEDDFVEVIHKGVEAGFIEDDIYEDDGNIRYRPKFDTNGLAVLFVDHGDDTSA